MKDYSEETIVVYFVPSRPADEILEMVGPLEQMLEDELAKLGFEVGEVQVLVSSTYEAAGEALLAGTGDIAFLPGGTYVAYKDVEDSPLQVMVAATRAGLTKDSTDAMAWNDGLATDNDSEYQVEYYKGLIIAGTSAAARTVSDKVNSGADLVWDDVKDLNWCVRSATSSSGYIYPNIWLQENFGMTFDDIEGDVVSTSGYGDSAASIASGVCDVATFYADARRDNAEKWTTDFGRTATIWEETDVIGVTANIMNDTITASTVNLGQDMIVAKSCIHEHFSNRRRTCSY
jgi:phosphonate transport system substrate-binding protein